MKKWSKLCQNQSKSIKFVTSCAGHIDGMKNKLVIAHSKSLPRQNQVKLFREEVGSHLQLLMLKN